MDGHRFDELTKTLVTGVSRRVVVRGVVAGVGGAVLGAFGRTAEAAPNSCAVGCAGLPGPQKAACKQACRARGGDINQVCIQFGPVGPSGFTCCPEGTACDPFTGECIEIAFCPTGEPAENCAAGIESSCGEAGECALVDAADGEECQCIVRDCPGIPCTTDADCAEFGFVCVSAPRLLPRGGVLRHPVWRGRRRADFNGDQLGLVPTSKAHVR